MLKIEDLHIYYGHVHALKGIALEIQDGELVALLGPNGAGKSTTLMGISGIVRPRSGTIQYDGTDITKKDPQEIVELGIIHSPEGRRIFGNLSVIENLRMGAVRRKDKGSLKRIWRRCFRCSLFWESASIKLGDPIGGRTADAGYWKGSNREAPPSYAG